MLYCPKATTFASEINKQRIISNNYNNNLKTKKIMKKIQFMSLMALMLLVSNSAMAQLDSKSEISFSVGTYTPNEKGIGEAIGEGLGTAIGQMVATIITFGQVDLTSKTQKEESYSPTFNLQYLYRVAPKVKVGASLTYQHTSAKLMAEKQSGGYLDIAKATNDYFTVMPVAKFMWIEKDHIGLYSKAAAGICIASKSDPKYCNGVQVDPDRADRVLNDLKTDKGTRFAYQVSAIGFEAGSKNLRGFVELGYGFQGLAQAGVSVKF